MRVVAWIALALVVSVAVSLAIGRWLDQQNPSDEEDQ